MDNVKKNQVIERRETEKNTYDFQSFQISLTKTYILKYQEILRQSCKSKTALLTIKVPFQN